MLRTASLVLLGLAVPLVGGVPLRAAYTSGGITVSAAHLDFYIPYAVPSATQTLTVLSAGSQPTVFTVTRPQTTDFLISVSQSVTPATVTVIAYPPAYNQGALWDSIMIVPPSGPAIPIPLTVEYWPSPPRDCRPDCQSALHQLDPHTRGAAALNHTYCRTRHSLLHDSNQFLGCGCRQRRRMASGKREVRRNWKRTSEQWRRPDDLVRAGPVGAWNLYGHYQFPVPSAAAVRSAKQYTAMARGSRNLNDPGYGFAQPSDKHRQAQFRLPDRR